MIDDTIPFKMKILISTGEKSGDLHGSNLAKALFDAYPHAKIIGIGSALMKAAGVDVRLDLSTTSTIGIFEHLKFFGEVFNGIKEIVTIIQEEQPDIFIPIDAQGLHMMVLKKIQNLPCKKVYFISPQEWQWGSDKGGQDVLELVDKILAIFPQEAAFYKRLGGNVSYVGHPILESSKSNVDKLDFYNQLKLDLDKKILGVFPGSRAQEIKHTAPILIQAALMTVQSKPDIYPVISVVDKAFESDIIKLCEKFNLKKAILYKQNSQDLIKHSYFSFLSSGTIALEHAVMNTPCLAAYKFSWPTYLIAKTVFRKKLKRLPFMTLPNLIMNKEIIPEFLQNKAKPQKLLNCFNEIDVDQQRNQFESVRARLGGGGSYQKAVKVIQNLL